MAEGAHTPQTTAPRIDACTSVFETDFQDDPVLQYEASLDEHQGLFNVLIEPNSDQPSLNVNNRRISETEPICLSSANQSDLTTLSNNVPCLTICMLVIGTRGDVQPFIAFGRALIEEGHRVRLATHEFHRDFVLGYGLQFFPLAGDPSNLMQFMVKSAGIVPRFSDVMRGEIAKYRRVFKDILNTCWEACIANDPHGSKAPFRADVIISNPPAYGHIHCAEKLQIPLHILFPMPWTPTDVFPHPFCVPNSESMSRHGQYINSLTFTVVDRLTWTGLGGCVNDFRHDTLQMSTLHARQATRALIDEQVPHTYCWSEAFIPRPPDWPLHIKISGYLFLNAPQLPENTSLREFLEQGTRPIYIGFGSIIGHARESLLRDLLVALNNTSTRAIMHNLAEELENLPNTVYRLNGNVDHDWLFPQVDAVCHHGGAGTTAAGLRAGRPTIIIPFFGDQFFNAHRIQELGAGRRVLPRLRDNVRHLAEAITFVKSNEAHQAAEQIQEQLEEDGCDNALRSLYEHLPVQKLQSAFEITYAARYEIRETSLSVSLPVAQVLVLVGLLIESQLQSLSTRKWQFSRHSPFCIRNWRFSVLHRNHESDVSLEPCDKIVHLGNEIYVGCARLFGTLAAAVALEDEGWYVKNPPPNDDNWTKQDDTRTVYSSMQMASRVSGYSPEVCEKIVRDFKSYITEMEQ